LSCSLVAGAVGEAFPKPGSGTATSAVASQPRCSQRNRTGSCLPPRCIAVLDETAAPWIRLLAMVRYWTGGPLPRCSTTPRSCYHVTSWHPRAAASRQHDVMAKSRGFVRVHAPRRCFGPIISSHGQPGLYHATYPSSIRLFSC
jgi:hypothetical protein